MGCKGKGAEVGMAMALAIGAGLSTVLGALFVVFAKISDLRYIAAAISFATGVMLYISFVDIYVGKSIGHFIEGGYDPAHSFLYATLCFFGGIPLTIGLDYIANIVLNHSWKSGANPHQPLSNGQGLEKSADSTLELVKGPKSTEPGFSRVPLGIQAGEQVAGTGQLGGNALDAPVSVSANDMKVFLDDEDSHNFAHAGLLAGLAIAVHNLPEGLVTFISYMSSPSVGFTTALAIAIHNIPEGMVVALPVYYATGSKLKALFWSAVAGFTEPIGAIIGLIIACTGELSNPVFGVLFGFISGIMVYVSLMELYPKAKKYDPEDKVTSKMIVFGMIVMALSLVVIAFAEL